MQYNETTIQYILITLHSFRDAFLGGVGGVAGYMFEYTKCFKDNKKKEWNNIILAINFFLGGFTANSIGSFIPHDVVGRDGIIGFVGVSSYGILLIIESKFAEIILKKVFGINISPESDKNKGDKK